MQLDLGVSWSILKNKDKVENMKVIIQKRQYILGAKVRRVELNYLTRNMKPRKQECIIKLLKEYHCHLEAYDQ